MSLDHQMSDFSQSETEPDQISIPADITAAYKRGPPQVVYKGNQFTWKQHHDNERAFTRSSVIWQLGDEYEKLSAAFIDRITQDHFYKLLQLPEQLLLYW